MTRTKLILASAALAIPAVLALGLKVVHGSEPPGRLVVNGDGTVTDTVTKLVWQVATGSTDNGQGAAVTSCTGTSLGPFTSGWRLPTVKELLSIVDFESATSPMIDTAVFGVISTGGPYATATIDVANNQAYAINFASGALTTVTTGFNGGNTMWRCVHSPASPTDAGADTGP